jgi:hypothetical protein
MPDRRSRALSGIDTSVGRGLEVGPLNRPLLPKSAGRISTRTIFLQNGFVRNMRETPTFPITTYARLILIFHKSPSPKHAKVDNSTTWSLAMW